MAPKEIPNWLPTPVYPYIQYPTVLFPVQPQPLPESQPAIDSDDSSDVDSDEEYLGYPSFKYYLYSYVQPEPVPFNSFDYLNEIQIPESENIFGNLFGDPIFGTYHIILYH